VNVLLGGGLPVSMSATIAPPLPLTFSLTLCKCFTVDRRVYFKNVEVIEGGIHGYAQDIDTTIPTY
jgi:hypothetical protein